MHIEVSRHERWAVVDVIDAGEGIPEDEREQIFEPFRQLGQDGRGAGLGLALVRRIARLHGGDAAVARREDDARCCFRVTLPVSSAA